MIVWMVFGVLGGAGPASGETWRMAGTFNGWNATDPAWTLVAQGDPPTRHVIERRIPAGWRRFRFVRDGDAESGRLGASVDDPSRLVEGGEDIPLRTWGEAVYRVTLDTQSRSWSIVPVKADRTVFDARLIGTPVAGGCVLLDMSRSLTVERWDRGRLVYEAAGGQIVKTEAADGTGRRIRLFLGEAGPMTLTVRLRDGGGEYAKSFDLEVRKQAVLRYLTRDDANRPRSVLFEPQGGGVERALLSFAQETEILALEVETGAGEVVRSEGGRIPAGAYAVEIRDGSVVAQRDPSLPFLLTPGNWRVVTFEPRGAVERVHLVADFNGWARPGSAGAIELVPRSDGVFAAVINPPIGAHRYRFLVDGEREVVDGRMAESVGGVGGRAASVMRVGPGPAEFPPVRAGSINMGAVRHDPSSRRDFRPISRELGLADISLTTLRGDAESVSLMLEVAGPGGRERRDVAMVREADFSGFDRWTARVMTGEAQAVYSFRLTDGAASEATQGYSASIEPAFDVPAWALGAVWYEIVPDRFRNGNPANDPRGPGVFLMNWTDDWATVGEDEGRAWRERHGVAPDDPWPPRKGGPLHLVARDRRYGGDLQGIAEKFEYLRGVGATAICLTPIFRSESLDKFDTSDYRHIDESLGAPASAGAARDPADPAGETADPKTWTWTEADRYFVEEFLPAARRHGLRVVLDMAPGFSGRGFFAFRDVEEKGEASAYRDWYAAEFDDQGRLTLWESRDAAGRMPMFRRTPEGDLSPGVKEFLLAVARRWMDPNGDGNPSDGIDGWRMLGAEEIGPAFWRDWRRAVKSINPQAVILAELWGDAGLSLEGDEFDGRMNYPFASAATEWIGVKPAMTARALQARLMQAFNGPPQACLAGQSLLGSRDTDRVASMLMNPGRGYDRANRPQDEGVSYRESRPGQDEYRAVLLGAAMQALYTGSPMIYYGDEAGMWGADDPSNRKPFPWDDLTGGGMKNADERAEWALQTKWARLMSLRQDAKIGPALRYGAAHVLETPEPGAFAFERSLNGARVIVVINRQNRTFNARPLLPAGANRVVVPAVDVGWWAVE